MFFATRIPPAADDYVAQFKAAEENCQALLAASPLNLAAVKRVLLNTLILLCDKLKNSAGVTYQNFIPLYDLIIASPIFNAKKHPIIDFLLRKSRTNTLQDAMSIVRNVACSVVLKKVTDLHSERNTLAGRNYLARTRDYLDRASTQTMFTQPRSNWAVSDTKTSILLRHMYYHFCSEERHSRGIFTPPMPVYQPFHHEAVMPMWII